MEARKVRGAAIAETGNIREGRAGQWLVPSQTGHGTWVVDYGQGEPTCTCPDYEKRSAFCKHIFAIEILQRRLMVPTMTEAEGKARPTYKQNWPAYNAAQMNEEAHFHGLLYALCQGITMPEQTGRGRPKTPLADVVFACVLKVYTGFSGQRATSELKRCEEQGLMRKAPHHNTISDAMNNADLTSLLRVLVQESASPLAGVESYFSPDSTGFSTRSYDRWFDQKWGKQRKRAKFRKAHAICGTKTHIVTDLLVNDQGDATQFKALVDATGRRFNMVEISADKAYLSKKNLEAANAHGAVPYIPFKEGITGKGPALWSKMFHYYQYKREDFDAHYHRRSNIETVFSMVKMKFGAALRSKSRTAQVNELYCKFLCHNICVLVSSIYELGLVPEFWQSEVA